MTTKTARQLYEEQRDRDIKHHKQRVKWLSGDNLCWVDGTPVSRSDRSNLLRQSKLMLEYLERVVLSRQSHNTGPKENGKQLTCG